MQQEQPTKKRKIEEPQIINLDDDIEESLELLDKTQLLSLLKSVRSKHPEVDKTLSTLLNESPELNIRICANCGEEFSELDDMAPDECCFHPGELKTCSGGFGEFKCDEDHWEDWDDFHGPRIGSDESKDEYPESYIYSCCGAHGGEEGCETSTHIITYQI